MNPPPDRPAVAQIDRLPLELERGWVADAVNAHLRARFAIADLEDTEAEEVRQLADR